MRLDEVNQLIKDYPLTLPKGSFEHRIDPISEAQLYAFIRKYNPSSALEIGTWYGGSTSVVLQALMDQKDGYHFKFFASELLEEMRRDTQKHCIELCNNSPVIVGDITKSLELLPDKFDFLLHDSDHDAETTQWVVDNIFPRLTPHALVVFHDWAVEEKDGKWVGKGENGTGGLPETSLLIKLHEEGKLPLKKIFWNWHNPGVTEMGFFEYIP